MNENPLVSVLIAAYNSEKYIGDAIESILASSYANFEMIICDDCSTDETAAIAKIYQQKDSRIKLFINETNLGDYPNRNRVASYAIGKYIKYLDHDDMIYPWGLEAMVSCMEKYPEAGFGLMSFGDLAQPTMYPVLVSPPDAYRSYFFNNALFVVGPTGAIFRRDAFESMKGFSGKPFVGDQEMWLKMSRYYPLVRMPLDIVWWRMHETQQSKVEQYDNMHVKRRFNVVKDALINDDCPLPLSERKIALRNQCNIKVRNIFKQYVFRLKFLEAFRQFKLLQLDWADIIKACKKNKLPD